MIWYSWIGNGVCDSYMGMALNEDETFLYVLNPDLNFKTARINFYEPGGGKNFTSYFLHGADLFNGENSFSYHMKSLNINSDTELLFLTAL